MFFQHLHADLSILVKKIYSKLISCSTLAVIWLLICNSFISCKPFIEDYGSFLFFCFSFHLPSESNHISTYIYQYTSWIRHTFSDWIWVLFQFYKIVFFNIFHRKPKGHNGCRLRMRANPQGAHMGLVWICPWPHCPTVNTQLPTVGLQGHVCWVLSSAKVL